MNKGEKYGRLEAIEFAGRNKRKQAYWMFECECGTVKKMLADNVKRGVAKSCGCLAREKAGKHSITHSMSRSRPYRIWSLMKDRCTNENYKAKKHYKDRGISFCERWHKFDNFWEDMKETYENHLTLDRIDNNAGYYKENCRWATREQQNNNKRNTIFIEYNGKTQTVSAWAKELGIKQSVIRQRRSKTSNVSIILKNKANEYKNNIK